MVSIDNGVALPYRSFCIQNTRKCERMQTYFYMIQYNIIRTRCLYQGKHYDGYRRFALRKENDLVLIGAGIVFSLVLCCFHVGMLRVHSFPSNDAEEALEWELLNFHQDMYI